MDYIPGKEQYHVIHEITEVDVDESKDSLLTSKLYNELFTFNIIIYILL